MQYNAVVESSVADPDHFDRDPYPAFQFDAHLNPTVWYWSWSLPFQRGDVAKTSVADQHRKMWMRIQEKISMRMRIHALTNCDEPSNSTNKDSLKGQSSENLVPFFEICG